MAAHTPGPWEWADHVPFVKRETLKAGPGRTVLTWTQTRVDGSDWTHIRVSDADARLIAAAPEMAEALKNLLWADDTARNDDILVAKERALAALKKAGVL